MIMSAQAIFEFYPFYSKQTNNHSLEFILLLSLFLVSVVVVTFVDRWCYYCQSCFERKETMCCWQ
jgi:hypothetical protein